MQAVVVEPGDVLDDGQIPDHTTIARFRARHEQPLADTFAGVLALCARAGLVSVGVVALDGSLISANASPAATRAYPEIRAEVERMLEEAAATDEREDAELGEARGDELPAGLGERRSRERLRRCREELRPHLPKRRCRRQRSTPPTPTPGLCNTAPTRSRAITPRCWRPRAR